MRLKYLKFLPVVLLLLAPGLAEATNRYGTASGGLSTGNCTVDTLSVTNGRCTLLRLLTQLVANDTGLLHAGTYSGSNGSNLQFTNAGTSGQEIILKPFGDGTVTISNTTSGTACFNFSGSTKRFYRLEDLICDANNTASTDGIDIQVGASDITFVRVTVQNTVGMGFFASANAGAISNITLTDCIANRADPTDTCNGLCHGIYFSSGANSLSNVTVSGGEYHGSGGRGIQIINSAFTVRVTNILVERTKVYDNNDGMVFSMYDGLTVRNNVIYRNNRTGSGSKGGILIEAGAGTTNIYNNTIVNNNGPGLPGLFIRSNVPTPLNVKNNIVQGNGGGNCAGDICSGAGFATNAFGGTGVSFVNAGSDDYHLASGDTIAKNQGTTISSFSTDFDGVSRPQGSAWDIGAFELVETPPEPPGVPRHRGRLRHI